MAEGDQGRGQPVGRSVPLWQRALGGSHLLPQSLELEVTESVLLQDSDMVAVTLDKLREIGVGIALDDFGTGYSSLSYLNRFHFDKIKIAQDFIREHTEKSESS